MATTQYIGARYVPLFYTASDDSNSWESGVQYEALTVVTYLNQSYTSKIPVPASVGNPADNPDYWIMTGAYNAQVQQYKQDVDQYKQDVDNYIAGERSLAYRKFLFIGDSYAEGYSPDGNVTGWPTLVAGILDLDASQWAQKYKGGAGFAANGQGKDFLDLLNDETGTGYTDIIVAGGYNDNTYTENQIVTAIASFMSAARTKYPGARVYIAHIGWTRVTTKIYDMAKSVRNYIHGAGAAGAVYICNSEFACRDYTQDFASDGIHLTSYGQAHAAQALTNGILGYSVDRMIPFQSMSITPAVDIGNNNLGQIACTLHNGIVTISSAAVLNMEFTSPRNFGAATGGNLHEIGTIDSGLVQGSNYNNLAIPVQCAFQNSGSYIDIPARLIIKNNKLYIAAMKVNSAGTGWETLNSVSYLYINGFSASFDATFC